jgi:hypothetical protein
VLAVHGLLGDPETLGDLLPGPPQRPGVIDLEDLQPFSELPEGCHGPEPGIRVGAGRALRDLEYWFHGRQHMLTVLERQHVLTELWRRGLPFGLRRAPRPAAGLPGVTSATAGGRTMISLVEELKSFTKG